MAEFINVQRDNGNSVDQAERDQLPDWQSAAGANNRERSRPRFDWRVALAVTLFVGGAGIWLTIRFVQFVASAAQQTSWLDGYIVAALKLTPLLLIGCAVFWLRERVANARIVRLQNNMPVARHAIEQPEWASAALGSVGAFYQVQGTWAAHSDYRSLNQLDMSSGAAKASDAPALTAGDAPLPVVPSAEWMQWVDRVPHILLAAETGGGKSTTAKAILAPRLNAGESTFVIDPHSSAWFDLPGVGGGENWPDVRRAMDAVAREYKARLDERDAYLKETGKELAPEHFPRLNVLLDEGNLTHDNLNSAKRGEQSPWDAFIITMGSGARKVRISIILLCQSANVADLDISGPMRENFTRIALDSGAAKKLIDAEEKDPARKKALHASLVDRDYPAVCEYKGAMYVLDRNGLDRVPAPGDAARCAWSAGYASVQNGIARVKPNVAEKRAAAIRKLQAQGITRDAARARGLEFDNNEWTAARSVVSEGA